MRLGIYYNKRTIAFKVMFDTSCKYLLPGEDQQDINKLFGIAYVPWYLIPLAIISHWFIALFRNQHHHNSARFGWRYNENINKIEIFAYCYVDGKRISDVVAMVPFNQFVEMQIEIGPTFYLFSVKKDQIELSTQVEHSNKKKWGYPLGVYFGGNQPAPKTMKVEMKKA